MRLWRWGRRVLADGAVGALLLIAAALVGGVTAHSSAAMHARLPLAAGTPLPVATPVPINVQVVMSTHAARLRTPEPPPNAGSVVHVWVAMTTTFSGAAAPAATVDLSATILGAAGSLGTGADGGTAVVSGTVIYETTGVADANGFFQAAVPLSSTLLAPGKGGRVVIGIRSTYGGYPVVSRRSLPLRENGLTLDLQPHATSRGAQRALCVLRRASWARNLIAVGLFADKGAAISGTLTMGTATIPASGPPGRAGAGRRTTLVFAVPSAALPLAANHLAGSGTVTATFRGATVSRSFALRCQVGTR